MRKFFRKIVIGILRLEAKNYLNKFKPQLIIVCGQNFRTNIKEDLVEFLSAAGFNVRGSFKGYNSEIGIPLSILNVQAGFTSPLKWIKLVFDGFFSSRKKGADILVLEVVVYNKKEAEGILKILKSNIIIFTDFDKSLNENAELKASYEKLLSEAGEGIALLNIDFESIATLEKSAKGRLVYFGLGEKAIIKASDLTEIENGQSFTYEFGNSEDNIFTNRFGKQAVYSALINKFLLSYFENKK